VNFGLRDAGHGFAMHGRTTSVGSGHAKKKRKIAEMGLGGGRLMRVRRPGSTRSRNVKGRTGRIRGGGNACERTGKGRWKKIQDLISHLESRAGRTSWREKIALKGRQRHCDGRKWNGKARAVRCQKGTRLTRSSFGTGLRVLAPSCSMWGQKKGIVKSETQKRRRHLPLEEQSRGGLRQGQTEGDWRERGGLDPVSKRWQEM